MGKLRYRGITWLLSMISRRSCCRGAELESLSGPAPSSYLLSTHGSYLGRTGSLMPSLQVWKKHVHPVTTYCLKPAQPVTKSWLQAGSRSRQPLRQAVKAANGWIRKHHHLQVFQEGKLIRLRNPQQLPGNESRKPGRLQQQRVQAL